MGSVFTDKIIVQRLTDLKWMALSSTHEDSRVYHNAKILVALRACVEELRGYYQTVDASSPTFLPNRPHPRYYPYPSSFTAGDNTLTHFRYLKVMEDDPTSVTYLAEITDQDGDVQDTPVKVVVKFVTRYGEEVHKFLAENGWAPNLRYYGPLRENVPSDDFLGPTRNAPPGLRLQPNLMSMVVMDYVYAQPNPPLDAISQMRTILEALHENGYVFGDLRPPNVLFDTDNKVKFIDFDWSGRYNKDDILADGNQVSDDSGPYAYYPLAMSDVADRWAPGMKPLVPSHDMAMLDKFRRRLKL
jgi:hypothetical protein